MRTSSPAAVASVVLVLVIPQLFGKDKTPPNWQPKWVNGTISEITQQYDQTAWHKTGQATTNVAGSATATETDTRYGVHYTDYTVQVEDRVYVLRSLPIKEGSPSVAKGLVQWATGARYNREMASPNLPVGVGGSIRVTVDGTNAWLEIGNTAYPCSVLRQTLLVAPATARPPLGSTAAPTQKPEPAPATKPDPDPNATRPTLRRE